jgi:hypothetical protein
MKMQLSPITTTNIANSRSAYYAPQQRQGATVEQSVRDLIKSNVSRLVQAARATQDIDVKDENLKLAKAFNEVLKGMKRASADLTIKAEKTGNVLNFTILPAGSQYSYIVGSCVEAILKMFNMMLEDLQTTKR